MPSHNRNDYRITTDRLQLRPTVASDDRRAFEILSNWNVSKNLAMATFPPNQQQVSQWFARHNSEWQEGTAYRFAMMLSNRMIGVIDIDSVKGGTGSLGYWLDETSWGQGYAKEAARALIVFAFEELMLDALEAGHAEDNHASQNVLESLGFHHIDGATIRSHSRNENITQRKYSLSNAKNASPSAPL